MINNSLFFPQRFRLWPVFVKIGIMNKPTSRATMCPLLMDQCFAPIPKQILSDLIWFYYYWFYLILWQIYSEPWHTLTYPDISKMELLVKLVNGFQPLPISAKSSMLDNWHDFEKAFVSWARLIRNIKEYQASYFLPPTSFSSKMRSKNLGSIIRKLLLIETNFWQLRVRNTRVLM